MSFLGEMFGGDAEAQAAERNRALYADYLDKGTGFLKGGLDKSLGALGSGYGGSSDALSKNFGVYDRYKNDATSALNNGLASSTGALTAAKNDYNSLDALSAKYGTASTMLLNSLGVNGAAGNASAVNSFQAGPGYNFALDQGNNAINRRRAAGGMMNSGNADIDALKFGQGLANQEYGNWQTKLSGFTPLEASTATTAATGRAGLDTNLANLYANDAANRVGVAGNVANGSAATNTGIAGNAANLGTGQAGLYTQNASDLTNLYGNVTSGNAAANNQEAAGKANGMKNLAGLGQSLLGSAFNFAGGGFGGLGGGGGTGGTGLSLTNHTGLY